MADVALHLGYSGAFQSRCKWSGWKGRCSSGVRLRVLSARFLRSDGPKDLPKWGQNRQRADFDSLCSMGAERGEEG